MSSGQASAPAPEGYQPECVDYLLQVASQKVTSQGNAFDQLDSKMGVMLGFATVAVLQVLAALFQLWSNPSKVVFGHPHVFASAFILGLASITVAAACGLLSLAPKDFDYGPDFEECAHCKAKDLHELKLFALNHYHQAIKGNQSSNDKKVASAAWATRLLFVGLVFFVLSIMILYLPSV